MATLSTQVFGNTLELYLIAAGVMLAILLTLLLAQRYVLRYAKKVARKTKSHLDDAVIAAVDKIPLWFYLFASVYVVLPLLVIPDQINIIIGGILVLLIAYHLVRTVNRIVDYLVTHRIKTQDCEEGSSLIRVMGRASKVIFWFLGSLVVLANFDVDITPLVTGLGVGGIAIAFAVQNILEDIFSAFSIYLDKPFKEGDFIVIGSDAGTIKHIGIKSTRIKTLQGQELVVSNREITATRVNNYKQMQQRRVAFSIGVEYGTPTKKLQWINTEVEKIIKATKGVKFGRVHFKEFGDFSLLYEIVYFVTSSDYEKYLNAQQDINFALKSAFEKKKIEMAFPTQTVHLKRG